MDCTALVIPRTNFEVTFLPSIVPDAPIQTKIWTPGKLRGRNYQNRRFCQYHVVCPPGQLLHYGFRTGNMDIEPENPTFDLCLDFATIENFSEDSVQICGSQSETTGRRDAPLRVDFRSNSRGRYPGFQIDVICVSPKFSNLPGCRESLDANSTNVLTPLPGRKRRWTGRVSIL